LNNPEPLSSFPLLPPAPNVSGSHGSPSPQVSTSSPSHQSLSVISSVVVESVISVAPHRFVIEKPLPPALKIKSLPVPTC